MALDLKAVQKIINSPGKKAVINKASRLQKRARFHTETNVSESDIYAPVQDFLEWVRLLLPKDKFNVFLQLFKFPLPTPAVTEDVYRELERVFSSRNATFTYQFTDPTLEEDWIGYRQRSLNEPEVWKTEGWQKMKTSVCSILVVDMPPVQVSDRPEPYFYWLEIEDVVDYHTPDGLRFDWLVFRQPEDRIAAFDDTFIRVYQTDGMNRITGLVSEAVHGLGYCPARFYWSSFLTENQKDLKKNPITKEFSNLDWYLFFSVSKRHLDTYASYPIYSSYEADCDFLNNETGDYCDGGYLRDSSGSFKITGHGTVEQCPCCSQKRIAGPGSYIEVPVPNMQDGIVDMRNPVQITTIDRDSLDYNVDECKRLHDDIIAAVVGTGGNGSVSEKEAINETQVAANFESKTAVLNALKINFEQAQKFVEDTVCRLRYGADFISSVINWGTEFYVFTIAELYDKYKKAKENGASGAELDAISKQIIDVEYRNNPVQLQRMLLLHQLEPYRHFTLEEIIQLNDKGLLDSELVILKINFPTFVDRFERENTDITEFARNLPVYERVNIINKKLLEYVRQQNVNPASPVLERGGKQAGAAQGGREDA